VSKPARSLAPLSHLHLVVLACAYYERADTVEGVARALGLQIDEVERVCAELEAAGYLAWIAPN
jgi:DNA-binding MarR family transcriptional regulator